MHEQAASNDRIDYERIGQFIYSFHRVCGSVEELSKTALAENAPTGLRERAASLARKLGHLLDNAALTDENEFESMLREASEVQSEIDRWRST